MEAQHGREVDKSSYRNPVAEPPAKDYPIREYIAGMARELAQMARYDGDEVLAALLEASARRAMRIEA